MKIWSWKSAIALWLFSWAWISAFDATLPRAVNWSTSYYQYQEQEREKEVTVEQILEDAIHDHAVEQRTLYYTALGLPL